MATYIFTKETKGFSVTKDTQYTSYADGTQHREYISGGIVKLRFPSYTDTLSSYDLNVATDDITVNGDAFSGTALELIDLLRDTVLFSSANSGGNSVSTDPDSPLQPQLAWYGSQAEYDLLTPVETTIYYII